jgi:NAD-dependent dihydropyrimidine dehydrogenase PreA subunit
MSAALQWEKSIRCCLLTDNVGLLALGGLHPQVRYGPCMKDDVAEVNEDECAACGVCIVLCQQDAITMVPSKMTLGERIDMGKDYTDL